MYVKSFLIKKKLRLKIHIIVFLIKIHTEIIKNYMKTQSHPITNQIKKHLIQIKISYPI